MSSTETTRRRDSAATRQALLGAASTLFGSRGFDRTSLREVGEAAGVDASLIARYFGNKVDLYLAVLEAEHLASASAPAGVSLEAIARRMLLRVDRHGVGPVLQAMVKPDTDPEIRRRAVEYLTSHVIGPIATQAEHHGIAGPQRHAELSVAALAGIIHLRAHGDLPAIASASIDEIVEWVTTVFDTASQTTGE